MINNSKVFDDFFVDQFAEEMKRKLDKKREEGRSGWADKKDCPHDNLVKLLREHSSKGDPVDVANFAMMLWARGEETVSRNDINFYWQMVTMLPRYSFLNIDGSVEKHENWCGEYLSRKEVLNLFEEIFQYYFTFKVCP